MKNQIIVDSCCDMTPEMRSEMGIASIPLTMMIEGEEYRDDEYLDMKQFMDAMHRSVGKAGSAAPSPFLYREAIERSEGRYVVTLSAKLSASYNNAILGNNEALQNGKGAACVFDSKSASAGETLIAIKLYELIRSGMPRERIIETARRFIDGVKTYFVLENYDNLRKNGRLGKAAGTLAHLLNIKLIMGADGNGEIALFAKGRGINKMIQQLMRLIETSGKDTQKENLVIAHCNNHSLVNQLTSFLKERFRFKNIYVVPTGGLSSLYTDNKGIVLAF
ncbi:MAG: DegV family protein [Coriobacteriales bacterium]|jgi:DegV family protein with EDD domain|nr:DegV family protein [Coriobacteriales bacterium]